MTDRQRVIRDIFTRATAAGRKVYGFGGKPGCELIVRGRVPDEFAWLCVEGDAEWTQLPADELAEPG